MKRSALGAAALKLILVLPEPQLRPPAGGVRMPELAPLVMADWPHDESPVIISLQRDHVSICLERPGDHRTAVVAAPAHPAAARDDRDELPRVTRPELLVLRRMH